MTVGVTNRRPGVLQFTRISESDAGRYICLAENLAGRSEGIAEVIVRRQYISLPSQGTLDTSDTQNEVYRNTLTFTFNFKLCNLTDVHLVCSCFAEYK